VQRVFVKVVGFSDVERHALNTLFRLSEERDVGYALWQPEYGVAAQLALIDSDSHEALVEFHSPSNAALKMVWIGPGAPSQAWRSFPRPLQWPDVIAAMDQLFQPPPDIEVDLDFDVSAPAELGAATVPGAAKRALIASASLDERLYLRARLALANLTQADEAENAADALALARQHAYDVALVDFALPGTAGWELIRQLRSTQPAIRHLIVTKDKVTAGDRVRGWRTGSGTLLPKPPHPGRLKELLAQV
jgi:CheY-like chemotaxis protein